MSGTVIPIGNARSATNNARCPSCGSEWWNLMWGGEGSTQQGAVILTSEEGQAPRIVGYTGWFACRECGEMR